MALCWAPTAERLPGKTHSKYVERAILWRIPQVGLAHTALIYNTFVISVLSYLWQLTDIPARTLSLEAPTIARLVPGPAKWVLPEDLFRLGVFAGLHLSFKSMAATGLAAKLRVYTLEPYSFDTKLRELNSYRFGAGSPTDQPLHWQL